MEPLWKFKPKFSPHRYKKTGTEENKCETCIQCTGRGEDKHFAGRTTPRFMCKLFVRVTGTNDKCKYYEKRD